MYQNLSIMQYALERISNRFKDKYITRVSGEIRSHVKIRPLRCTRHDKRNGLHFHLKLTFYDKRGTKDTTGTDSQTHKLGQHCIVMNLLPKMTTGDAF